MINLGFVLEVVIAVSWFVGSFNSVSKQQIILNEIIIDSPSVVPVGGIGGSHGPSVRRLGIEICFQKSIYIAN